MSVSRAAAASLLALIAVLTPALSAQQGMPDVRQMAGQPLPVGDLAPGSVVVRLVRGSLSNPLPGQIVELLGPAARPSQKTNDAGRAEFAGLTPGTRVRAVATIDGERLESQEFSVPATGGIRLLLVGSDPEARDREAEAAASPARPGAVVFGDQTRFVFEIGDDGLNVFSMLEVRNSDRTPVQPAEPLVIELPSAAENAALIDGSSPQATIAGKRVTIAGPFAPGITPVHVAYTLPYGGGELRVRQTLPAPLAQVTLLVQKVGEMHVASPQITTHREMTSEGQTYIVGQGPGLQAGDVLTVDLTGLPNAPRWPLALALAAALLILAAGAWAGIGARSGPADVNEARRRLEARREELFAELSALEERHRAARIEPEAYAVRRRELIASLESVYAALDEDAAV